MVSGTGDYTKSTCILVKVQNTTGYTYFKGLIAPSIEINKSESICFKSFEMISTILNWHIAKYVRMSKIGVTTLV